MRRGSLKGVHGLARALRIAAVALLATLVVTGCASAGASSPIHVAAAYVPAPTTPGTTVAYLQIRNNGRADRLISVQTSVGGKVQLRAPGERHAGVLTMHTVPDIPVPANSMTRLNPNSYHLLITGAGTMPDGKYITLRLTFANAGTIPVLAMVTNPQSGGGGSYFLS
jgi:periplasmic copper chaperone A